MNPTRRSSKEHIFREPSHGIHHWVVLLAGFLMILIVLLYTPLVEHWLTRLWICTMGLAIILSAGAEVLPKNRTVLAGILRIGYFVAVLCAVLLLAIMIFLSF